MENKYCIIREIDLKEIAEIITSNQLALLNRDFGKPEQNMLLLIQDKDLRKQFYEFVTKDEKDLQWIDADYKIFWLDSLKKTISEGHQRLEAYVTDETLLWVMLYDDFNKMDFYRFYIKR